jgi:MoaA/NifB/PqqE/SkfB family radical SAM enzyme
MRKKLSNILTLNKNVMHTLINQATKQLPKIHGIVYEVTDKCNSKCMHCNIWKNDQKKELLTKKELIPLLKEDLLKELKNLILTGGEPILYKNLGELILIIHKHLPNTRITLSTNGLLPDKVLHVVKMALENNIGIDVGVSLDGLGKKHDEIRGVKGNFKRVDYLLNSLKELSDRFGNHLNVVVGHTLSGITYSSLIETMNYVNRLNFPFFTQLCEEFSYYGNTNKIMKTDNEKLIKVIKKLPLSLHNECIHKSLKSSKKIRFKCSSMKTFFLLKCNGDVTPCLRYSDHIIGNIRENTFSRIWHSSRAIKERIIIKNCIGCSNTWATGWSFKEWPVSFIDVLVLHKIKQIYNRHIS